MSRRLVIALVVLLAVVGLPTVEAPRAEAATPTGLQVTLVARSCPSYTAVTANRARNNIQESLRDLGADTLYAGGEPISVAKENAGQPTCTPIPNWAFTLGGGYTTGNPENPSVVTGVNGSATTAASTPELDKYGNETGRSIAGATTITLTQQQAALAAQANRLWVQGGTPTDPLNDATFPGVYGFAALRCAIDNLNGDNVEWVSFPQGTSHVFCYAYYVTPPPGAATIVVQKQTVDGQGAALNVPQKVSFPFQGNVSYNDQPVQGAFDVAVAAGTSTGSTTFIRGETGTPASPNSPPWQFTERSAGGWTVVGATCVSELGQSLFAVDPTTFETTITRLVEGDTVTCTYRNRPWQAGDLALSKVTRNGEGGPFDFTVTPPSGSPVGFSAATVEPDVPELVTAVAAGSPLGLYTVTEQLPPASGAGTWAMTDVDCLGATPTLDLPNRTFSVNITTDNQAVSCQVENTFTPTASITIRKVTQGGVTTADFNITELTPDEADPLPTLNQSATTVTPGVAVTATGDPSTGLRLGSYQIYETDLAAATGGTWQLTGLDCGPIVDGSGVEVTLTEQSPHVTCTFTNTFVPDGSLTITKAVGGDTSLRTGPVVIAGRCADGQTFTLTAPAGEGGPWATVVTGFREPTTCIVAEVASGVAPGGFVTTAWTATADVSGCPAALPCDPVDPGSGQGMVAGVRVQPGQAVTLAVTDTYSPDDPGVANAGAISVTPAFTG